jgi:signal transduction histidine kinase
VAVVGRVRSSRSRREQALTELRADFVASASHELRTPLAQIRMFAELMRKGSLRTEEDIDRALRVIEKEANRLTILVDNILNFTRLRKRVARDVPVPARVAEEVRQVVADFEQLAAERRVRVEVEADEDAVAWVDSLALRQVLLNFLENAVKYGPRGGTVRVRAERAAEGRVRVAVEDQGPGVPEDEREKVWRAFYRRQDAIDSGETGSGIGLAVVRELVMQFGGTTMVEEVPGGGARFVAEFPGVEE